MDILGYIGDIFTVANLTGVMIGTIVGVILGALPGCTPSLGLAIFIPITYTMDFTTAMIYLGSIFVGGMYGGAITAILINVPGTAAAAACTIEGYKMTLHGRAKEALIESTTSNLIGSVFGILVLLFAAPKLAKMAFEFGPQENFMLAIFGLSVIASLSTKNMMKGIISGLLGLLLACIGMDPVYGMNRLTLGIHYLANGIQLVPAVIGLFAFAMVIGTLSAKKHGNNTDTLKDVKIDHHTKVTLKDFFRYPAAYLRSSVIGCVVGIIPGTGGEVASYLALNQGYMWGGKNMSDYEKETGWREGIGCVQAANGAVVGGTIIPTLTLGVPGNATAAILLSGLMMHGLTPGYDLFSAHADRTYPFIFALFFASIVTCVVGLFCAPMVAKITKCPPNILNACIMSLCIVGALCIRNSVSDLWIMFAFGIVGYFMKLAKYEIAPVLLGMILGKIAEKGLTQSLVLDETLGGVLKSCVTRPVCVILLVIMIVCIAYPMISEKASAKKAKK